MLIIDLIGDFDYDVWQKFPFVRVNKRMAKAVMNIVRGQGFIIRHQITKDIQAGKTSAITTLGCRTLFKPVIYVYLLLCHSQLRLIWVVCLELG